LHDANVGAGKMAAGPKPCECETGQKRSVRATATLLQLAKGP
jgi:hypothetical protein